MSEPTTESAQQTDAGATGGTPTGSGTQPATVAEAVKPGFTQDDLNRAIAEEKRKWKKAQDDAAAELKRKADEDAAAARGEFERLATERQQRITALEAEQQTAQEQLAAYQAEMARQIKARERALPEEIRAMKPDADPLTVYAWLEKAETAAAKLTTPTPPRPPLGTPPGPRGPGSATQTHAPDLIALKKASGDYAL